VSPARGGGTVSRRSTIPHDRALSGRGGHIRRFWARRLAKKLGDGLGQGTIRGRGTSGGAAGTIGAGKRPRGATDPDGLHPCVSAMRRSSHRARKSIQAWSYDPVKRFTPIGSVVAFHFCDRYFGAAIATLARGSSAYAGTISGQAEPMVSPGVGTSTQPDRCRELVQASSRASDIGACAVIAGGVGRRSTDYVGRGPHREYTWYAIAPLRGPGWRKGPRFKPLRRGRRRKRVAFRILPQVSPPFGPLPCREATRSKSASTTHNRAIGAKTLP